MLLGEIPFELLSLRDFARAGEAEEPEDTMRVTQGARLSITRLATDEMVLADDSGLEVKVLEGKPGVLISSLCWAEHDRQPTKTQTTGRIGNK